jgi:hypothetical protein
MSRLAKALPKVLAVLLIGTATYQWRNTVTGSRDVAQRNR